MSNKTKEQRYRINWCFKSHPDDVRNGGFTHTKAKAEQKAKELDKEYPSMTHWIEPV